MPIVAIGGGRRQPAIQEALTLYGQDHTRVLIIPSACSVESGYNRKVAAVIKSFSGMGLSSFVLHNFNEIPETTRLQDELEKSNLIYTIGGNTPHLLSTLSKNGFREALSKRIADGAIHAGVSAGALLPFDQIHSNPSSCPSQEDWYFSRFSGLGILRGIATAHANSHDPTPDGERVDTRLDNLRSHWITPDSPLGLAIDNGAAVIFGPDEPHIVRSVDGANVHTLEWTAGSIHQNTVDDPSVLLQFVKNHPSSP